MNSVSNKVVDESKSEIEEASEVSSPDRQKDVEAGKGLPPPGKDNEGSEVVSNDQTNNETGLQGPQSSKKPIAVSKSSRQLNPKFADVKETGKWGEVSRKEKMFTAVAILVVVIAVIALVVVFVTKDDDSPSPASQSGSMGTSAPTASPTSTLPQLDFLRQQLASNDLMSQYLDILPSAPEELEGLQDDDSEDPVVRAASWLIHVDQVGTTSEIMARFGLAVMFYANGGTQWTNNNLWLSPNDSVCDGWHGITCNIIDGDIDEIDLNANNLTGEIHPALSTISTVRILWLNNNRIGGTIPGPVFASLRELFILYLQENQLVGEIPQTLIGNGVLQTIFVHKNNLIGEWPMSFCGSVQQYRLDCEKVSCTCCDVGNCFD